MDQFDRPTRRKSKSFHIDDRRHLDRDFDHYNNNGVSGSGVGTGSNRKKRRDAATRDRSHERRRASLDDEQVANERRRRREANRLNASDRIYTLYTQPSSRDRGNSLERRASLEDDHGRRRRDGYSNRMDADRGNYGSNSSNYYPVNDGSNHSYNGDKFISLEQQQQQQQQQQRSKTVIHACDDKTGKCLFHPHITLRKKAIFGVLGGWVDVLRSCPECEEVDLRNLNSHGVSSVKSVNVGGGGSISYSHSNSGNAVNSRQNNYDQRRRRTLSPMNRRTLSPPMRRATTETETNQRRDRTLSPMNRRYPSPRRRDRTLSPIRRRDRTLSPDKKNENSKRKYAPPPTTRHEPKQRSRTLSPINRSIKRLGAFKKRNDSDDSLDRKKKGHRKKDKNSNRYEDDDNNTYSYSKYKRDDDDNTFSNATYSHPHEVKRKKKKKKAREDYSSTDYISSYLTTGSVPQPQQSKPRRRDSYGFKDSATAASLSSAVENMTEYAERGIKLAEKVMRKKGRKKDRLKLSGASGVSRDGAVDKGEDRDRDDEKLDSLGHGLIYDCDVHENEQYQPSKSHDEMYSKSHDEMMYGMESTKSSSFTPSASFTRRRKKIDLSDRTETTRETATTRGTNGTQRETAFARQEVDNGQDYNSEIPLQSSMQPQKPKEPKEQSYYYEKSYSDGIRVSARNAANDNSDNSGGEERYYKSLSVDDGIRVSSRSAADGDKGECEEQYYKSLSDDGIRVGAGGGGVGESEQMQQGNGLNESDRYGETIHREPNEYGARERRSPLVERRGRSPLEAPALFVPHVDERQKDGDRSKSPLDAPSIDVQQQQQCKQTHPTQFEKYESPRYQGEPLQKSTSEKEEQQEEQDKTQWSQSEGHVSKSVEVPLLPFKSASEKQGYNNEKSPLEPPTISTDLSSKNNSVNNTDSSSPAFKMDSLKSVIESVSSPAANKDSFKSVMQSVMHECVDNGPTVSDASEDDSSDHNHRVSIPFPPEEESDNDVAPTKNEPTNNNEVDEKTQNEPQQKDEFSQQPPENKPSAINPFPTKPEALPKVMNLGNLTIDLSALQATRPTKPNIKTVEVKPIVANPPEYSNADNDNSSISDSEESIKIDRAALQRPRPPKDPIEEKVKTFATSNLPWTGRFGESGMYTGYVNEQYQPHGRGTMVYDHGEITKGHWKDGNFVRESGQYSDSESDDDDDDGGEGGDLSSSMMDLGHSSRQSRSRSRTRAAEAPAPPPPPPPPPPPSYNIGETAKDDDMLHEAAKIKELVPKLQPQEGAFIRRSDGKWTYAVVKQLETNNDGNRAIRFTVNERNSSKSYAEKYWFTHIRPMKVPIQPNNQEEGQVKKADPAGMISRQASITNVTSPEKEVEPENNKSTYCPPPPVQSRLFGSRGRSRSRSRRRGASLTPMRTLCSIDESDMEDEDSDENDDDFGGEKVEFTGMSAVAQQSRGRYALRGIDP